MLADQTKHHKAHAEEGHAAPVITSNFPFRTNRINNVLDSSVGKVMRGLSH